MSLWKEPKPDNGHLGEPMERLMFDFLVRSFGSDKVVLQPGRYPSNIGNTYPDVMVKDSNCRLFADVTVSPLDTGSWLMREDPKKSQRHIFENPSEIGVSRYSNISASNYVARGISIGSGNSPRCFAEWFIK